MSTLLRQSIASIRASLFPILTSAGLFVLLSSSVPSTAPPSIPEAVPPAAFEGEWALAKGQSSPVDPWNNLSLKIEADSSQVTLIHHWKDGRFSGIDSMVVKTGGVVNRAPIDRWLDNRHLGVSIRENTVRRVTAEWLDDGRTLQVTSRFPVHTSQGTSSIRILSEYRLSPNRESLSLLQLRSTRPKPLHYSFHRAEAKRM